MVKTQTHSEMEFAADNSFSIEKAGLNQHFGEEVKTVEFIRAKDNKLSFIEARTTFPNPDNSSESFSAQVCEVCDKFVHSLNMYAAVDVGAVDISFPSDFNTPDKVLVVFVLVIRNHKKEWCREVSRAIEVALPLYVRKIWRASVFVINHETAMNKGLAIS